MFWDFVPWNLVLLDSANDRGSDVQSKYNFRNYPPVNKQGEYAISAESCLTI